MKLNRRTVYGSEYNLHNHITYFLEIPLRGPLRRTGSQSYKFYEYLELHFWDNYRRGGKFHGKAVPTNQQYNEAVQAALIYADLSIEEAITYAKLARQELEDHGFLMEFEVPIIPNYQPFIQRKGK
jgi:hypothetical protein